MNQTQSMSSKIIPGLRAGLLSLLAASFLTACSPATPSARLLYPEPEAIEAAAQELNSDTWTLEEISRQDSPLDPTYEESTLFQLYNQDKSVRCQLGSYLRQDDASGLTVSFWFDENNGTSQEQYDHFIEEELDEIWELAAAFSSNKEAMETLCSRLEASYADILTQYEAQAAASATPPFTYYGVWGGQNSDIYAECRLVKGAADLPPRWSEIQFKNGAEYNSSETFDEALLKTIPELMADPAKDINHYIYGTLTDIAPAGLDRPLPSQRAPFPDNVDSYYKATLNDEAGNIPVYITPTALTEEELKQKRLHKISVSHDEEKNPVYVITGSMLYESG